MRRLCWLLLALTVWSCSGNDPEDAPADGGRDAGTDVAGPDAEGPDSEGPDGEAAAWDIAPGCNPYAYREDCLFPFPSDVFLVPDESTPSGRRLELPPAAQVDSRNGPADPTAIRVVDGAPLHPGIFVYLEDGFDATQFAGPQDDAASNPTSAAKTLLIEADTGRLVPHFAETFQGWTETTGRLLAVRPLAPLRPATRYVVSLQNVVDLDGELLQRPHGFRQMMSGELDGAPERVVAEAARLRADVVPVVEATGARAEDLVLAWDFTTATAEHTTADLRHMRADAVARLDAVPPQIRITRILEGDQLEPHLRETVFRQIEGELLAVPSYLEGGDGQRLRRGPDGRPLLAQNIAVEFMALIPRSVAANAAQSPSSRIVQFGHGFLGSREEMVENYQHRLAHRLGYVIAAVDWWGFAREDLAQLVPRLSGDLGNVFFFADRLAQAMINQIALEYAIVGAMHDHDAFRIDGRRTYDPEQHYFLGVSGGGIFGGTFAALATHVSRFVLNVGGASFSMLMSRSDAFGAFSTLLHAAVGELDAHKVVALAPYALDPVDPIAWGAHLGDQRILMQIGLGDTAVPTLAAEVAARGIGATLLTPSPRDSALLPTSNGPLTSGHGLVIVDFGVDPAVGRPWKPIDVETPAHEGVRRFEPMIEQMDIFFSPDGPIVHPCEGPCVALP